MHEEPPSDGVYKPRPALGDVTNQVAKRGFCSIYKKYEEGIQIAKKECLRVEQNHNKQIPECVLSPRSTCEIKEPCPPGVRQNATSTVKAGDAVRDVCESTQLDGNGPCVMVQAVEDERIESKRMVGNDLGLDDGNGVSFDKLDLIKDEYLESQESRCGLETCIGPKGDRLSSVCMDMIKTCPCSFCMKAAYLLSDLHYQDIKGRIAATKKSQKQASILVDRNSMNGARNFGKFSNKESDLTGRWKSLFLHMEKVFVREGTQLETRSSSLKNLVDIYKSNSEKN